MISYRIVRNDTKNFRENLYHIFLFPKLAFDQVLKIRLNFLQKHNLYLYSLVITWSKYAIDVQQVYVKTLLIN